jgi:hypothetical protein
LQQRLKSRAAQLALNKLGNGIVQNFGQRIIGDYKAVQTDLIAFANKLHASLKDTTTIDSVTFLT